MPPRIVNIHRARLEHQAHGQAFESRLASFTALLGARQLGCQLTVVPAGKRAWPMHAHLVNEELVFVLEGRGTVRYAGGTTDIEAGDLVSFVAGPDNPHQIVNTSDAELLYLCISTMQEPEVVLYPDSGKYAVIAGSLPGGDESLRTFSVVARASNRVPYWDGEDGTGAIDTLRGDAPPR